MAHVIQAVAHSRLKRRKTVNDDSTLLNLNKFGEDVLQDLLDSGYEIVAAGVTSSSDEEGVAHEGFPDNISADLELVPIRRQGDSSSPHQLVLEGCKEWLWFRKVVV